MKWNASCPTSCWELLKTWPHLRVLDINWLNLPSCWSLLKGRLPWHRLLKGRRHLAYSASLTAKILVLVSSYWDLHWKDILSVSPSSSDFPVLDWGEEIDWHLLCIFYAPVMTYGTLHSSSHVSSTTTKNDECLFISHLYHKTVMTVLLIFSHSAHSNPRW